MVENQDFGDLEQRVTSESFLRRPTFAPIWETSASKSKLIQIFKDLNVTTVYVCQLRFDLDLVHHDHESMVRSGQDHWCNHQRSSKCQLIMYSHTMPSIPTSCPLRIVS